MTPALAAALARAEAADAAALGIVPRRAAAPVSKTRRIAGAARGVSWTLDRAGKVER